MLNRRSFVGMGSLAMLASGCQSVSASRCAGRGKVKFRLGMAGYTYHKFTLDQTLDAMQKLDVRYLCIKDFHLPMKSTAAEIAEFKRKCADHGVTGYGVGPIYMLDDDAAKRAFDYAAAIGVKIVVAVPAELREIGVSGKLPSRQQARMLRVLEVV